MSEYRLKIGIFVPTVSVWPKISGRRGRPHQPFFFSGNRVNDLSCGIRMLAQLSFVLSQITHLTDGQTDRHLSRKLVHAGIPCSTVTNHTLMVQNWIYFEYPNFYWTSHCYRTTNIKVWIQSELHTYWKLTLSIENRVSNMPDVKTRQRRISYAVAMHRKKNVNNNTQTHKQLF